MTDATMETVLIPVNCALPLLTLLVLAMGEPGRAGDDWRPGRGRSSPPIRTFSNLRLNRKVP